MPRSGESVVAGKLASGNNVALLEGRKLAVATKLAYGNNVALLEGRKLAVARKLA